MGFAKKHKADIVLLVGVRGRCGVLGCGELDFYKAIEHSWALTTTFATISPKICRVVANFLTLPMKRDLTNGMRFRCLKCFKEDSV